MAGNNFKAAISNFRIDTEVSYKYKVLMRWTQLINIINISRSGTQNHIKMASSHFGDYINRGSMHKSSVAQKWAPDQ